MSEPLSSELLNTMNAYRRAANYLSVGQIHIKDDPLFERPLTMDDIRSRLLDHWRTTRGPNFAETTQKFNGKRQTPKLSQYGEDLPEVRNWNWSGSGRGDTSQDTGGENV